MPPSSDESARRAHCRDRLESLPTLLALSPVCSWVLIPLRSPCYYTQPGVPGILGTRSDRASLRQSRQASKVGADLGTWGKAASPPPPQLDFVLGKHHPPMAPTLPCL